MTPSSFKLAVVSFVTGSATSLLPPGGVGHELCGPSVLDRLPEEHASGTRHHLDTVGVLATVNAQVAMLRATRTPARAPQ
ncbi:MAG: hypothetical protein JW751_17125 [Polyangiaceae bacterium]|nr:hypothetical protein [Polyangiaceae bacterium]